MRNTSFLTLLTLGSLFLVFAALPFAVHAGPPDVQSANQPDVQSRNTINISPTIDNPLHVRSISGLVEALIGIVIQIAIPVAVVMLILSGFWFVTAQGSESKLEKAKATLLWTLVGIGVLLGAEAMVKIIQATINQLR